MNQLTIPYLIFPFILITCQLDIKLILKGEIMSWSLMGGKGLNRMFHQDYCLLFAGWATVTLPFKPQE